MKEMTSRTAHQEHFNNLLTNLRRFDEERVDFLTPLKTLKVNDAGQLVHQQERRQDFYNLSDFSKGQFANKLLWGIPYHYCQKIPNDLYAHNCNYQLDKMIEEDRKALDKELLIRTHNNNALGILTKAYKKLDNYDVVLAVGNAIKSLGLSGDFEIKQLNNSSEYFSAKFVLKDDFIVGNTNGKPDIHRIGWIITNSEVGKSALRVTAYIWRLVCSNGLIRQVSEHKAFKQVHLSHLSQQELFGKIDNAIFMSIEEAKKTIERLVEAKEVKFDNVEKEIERLTERYKFTLDFSDRVLKTVQAENDNTKFGIIQAITDNAKYSGSVEALNKFETIAGEYLGKKLVLAV
jgi:hypothetical protein